MQREPQPASLRCLSLSVSRSFPPLLHSPPRGEPSSASPSRPRPFSGELFFLPISLTSNTNLTLGRSTHRTLETLSTPNDPVSRSQRAWPHNKDTPKGRHARGSPLVAAAGDGYSSRPRRYAVFRCPSSPMSSTVRGDLLVGLLPQGSSSSAGLEELRGYSDPISDELQLFASLRPAAHPRDSQHSHLPFSETLSDTFRERAGGSGAFVADCIVARAACAC